MKPILTVAVGLLLLGSTALVRADEPKKDDNAAKILGTWELVKSDEQGAPIGAIVTFTKDGKLVVKVSVNGQEMKLEGSYKVEKDKLTTELKIGDMKMSDTDTIKKLTADELETVDKDGKVSYLKKKKD